MNNGNDRNDNPPDSSGSSLKSRRDVIRAGGALVAGALGSASVHAAGVGQSGNGVRGSLLSALPASFVGEAYTQLLSMADPHPNVAVAAAIDPATAQTIAFFNAVTQAENEEAAVRLGCAPPGRR